MEIEETRGTAAVGPENKKDGLQKCLSQNHAHLLFDNKNPLGCSRNHGIRAEVWWDTQGTQSQG